MPEHTKYEQQQERLAVLTMVLELMLASRLNYFGTTKLPRGIDDTTCMVLHAVGIGHFEGKPLNVTKVAEMCHISRTTARRKLGLMVERKLIVQKEGLFYVHPRRKAPPASAVKHVQKAMRICFTKIPHWL